MVAPPVAEVAPAVTISVTLGMRVYRGHPPRRENLFYHIFVTTPPRRRYKHSMFGGMRRKGGSVRRATDVESQHVERKSREHKPARRDVQQGEKRVSRRHRPHVEKGVNQVGSAPEVGVMETAVEPTPRTISAPQTLAVDKHEAGEVLERISLVEELLRIAERTAEERNVASVARAERVSRLLECMDERIGGVVQVLERRGGHDDDVMSAQKESIEAWEQSAAMVMKGLRQVVAGATAGPVVEGSGGLGGSPAAAVGAVARQEIRTNRTKDAMVLGSRKESSLTEVAVVEEKAAKQVDPATESNVGGADVVRALESEATDKVGGVGEVVPAAYRPPKFLKKK